MIKEVLLEKNNFLIKRFHSRDFNMACICEGEHCLKMEGLILQDLACLLVAFDFLGDFSITE